MYHYYIYGLNTIFISYVLSREHSAIYKTIRMLHNNENTCQIYYHKLKHPCPRDDIGMSKDRHVFVREDSNVYQFGLDVKKYMQALYCVLSM